MPQQCSAMSLQRLPRLRTHKVPEPLWREDFTMTDIFEALLGQPGEFLGIVARGAASDAWPFALGAQERRPLGGSPVERLVSLQRSVASTDRTSAAASDRGPTWTAVQGEC